MQLENKVVVVSGAGSGIGRELSLGLAQRGAIVAGVDYDGQSLTATRELVLALGGVMSEHVVDVSKQEQVSALPQSVLDAHGNIHGLINNAGIIHAHCSIEGLPRAQVERVFNVNWWGTYYMVMAFLPRLRAQDKAFICNLSSMGGYMPFPGQVAYGASKAAVKLLTEGLRVELRRDAGIQVSVVYPGGVSTGITENAPDISTAFKDRVRELTAEKQVGISAQSAARTILRGIQRGRSRITVGPDSWLIDKLYRLMPVATASLMAWLMAKFSTEDYDSLMADSHKASRES